MKRLLAIYNLLRVLVGLPALWLFSKQIYDLWNKPDADRFGSILLLLVAIALLALVTWGYLIFSNRIRKSGAYAIEKQLDAFAQDEGKNFLKAGGDALVNKTKESIKALMRNGVTNTLDSDVYYLYLFALLNGARRRIWAASILADEEWVDTAEETEFLRLNVEAAKRKVLVERIFVIRRDMLEKLPTIDGVKVQMNKRNDYLKTYVVFVEDVAAVKPSLLTDLGSGFLAFDDFAVAKDVFKDSYIRGVLHLDSETIGLCSRIFTNLRDFAHPLDSQSIKTIAG